jgi:hypothetical protein
LSSNLEQRFEDLAGAVRINPINYQADSIRSLKMRFHPTSIVFENEGLNSIVLKDVWPCYVHFGREISQDNCFFRTDFFPSVLKIGWCSVTINQCFGQRSRQNRIYIEALHCVMNWFDNDPLSWWLGFSRRAYLAPGRSGMQAN